MNDASRIVAEALLAIAEENRVEWDWVGDHPDRPLTKREANKFLLGCVVDYAQNADVAWNNVRAFAEGTLGDPEALWLRITEIPFRSWMAHRREYALHRYTKAHERVWKIAWRVVVEYSGDARNIWYSDDAREAHERLRKIGLGEQLSRMAVIALLRTGRMQGSMDVKADTHVCRVVGRIFQGHTVGVEVATSICRQLFPQDPSVLDGPLYVIGKRICSARTPRCTDCSLSTMCQFSKSHVPAM